MHAEAPMDGDALGSSVWDKDEDGIPPDAFDPPEVVENINEFNLYLRGFKELASGLDQNHRAMVEDMRMDAIALFMKHAMGQPQGRLRCDPCPPANDIAGEGDADMAGGNDAETQESQESPYFDEDWTFSGKSLYPDVIAGYLERRYGLETFDEAGALVPIGPRYEEVRRRMEAVGTGDWFKIYEEWRHGLEGLREGVHP